jgi:hypothetical protein
MTRKSSSQCRETPKEPEAEVPAEPAASAGDTPVRMTANEVSDHFASQLRDTAAAAFLFSSMAGTFTQADTAAFRKFRDQLLADAGGPTDPIEIMMIEQIILAHMNIGRLQFRSSTAESVELARGYGNMAAQLLAEFRRTCLALQAFRLSARQLARADAAQQVLCVETSDTAATTECEKETLDIEKFTKEGADHDDATVPFPAEEPASGGGRPDERQEAKRAIA